MRRAHLFSATLVAGAITIAGAVFSASVAPDTAGNPSAGSIQDARPHGPDEQRLPHATVAISPAQAKALAVNGFEPTAEGVHLRHRLHQDDFTAAGAVANPGRFARVTGPDEETIWQWRAGTGVVSLGDVTVFDAKGVEIPATLQASATQTRIAVDGPALAAAAYPVTVDPEIGANDFRLSDMGPDGTGLFQARAPAVAYNGTDNEYLVVWNGDDDTPPLVDDEREIFGQRFASTSCDCNAPDAISGTAGFNLLIGTPGDDILCGFEGRDLLFGLRGDDCIDGGDGRDLIFGGAGDDSIGGGEGFDRIFGGGGTDACHNGEWTFHCNP